MPPKLYIPGLPLDAPSKLILKKLGREGTKLVGYLEKGKGGKEERGGERKGQDNNDGGSELQMSKRSNQKGTKRKQESINISQNRLLKRIHMHGEAFKKYLFYFFLDFLDNGTVSK